MDVALEPTRNLGSEEVHVEGFRPSRTGIATRAVVGAGIAALVFLQPVMWDNTRDQWIGLAAIYAIIGLSINVITGHAGQISLGHQAFVGIGAFVSAFVIAKFGGFFPSAENLVLPPTVIPSSDFWMGVTVAGGLGAVMALLLGVVALRIRGLYLALITLAFGLMAETTVFNFRPFTGGGAGLPAPRPATFQSNQAFAFLCLLFTALFVFIDWRLVRSKAGRAIVTVRNEERVAATLGVNVTRYKLLAFATGGLLAGVAGALFAHWNQQVTAPDFGLQTALLWVLMSVVGGLGSRAGVIIGSAFFALFPLVVADAAGQASFRLPLVEDVIVQTLTPFLGALLLVLTITLYPGGIGQQILPYRRWLAGGPLVESRHEQVAVAGQALAVSFLALLLGGQRWFLALGLAAGVAVLTALLLGVYLWRSRRARAKTRTGGGRLPRPPAAGPAPVVPIPEPGTVETGPEAPGAPREPAGAGGNARSAPFRKRRDRA